MEGEDGMAGVIFCALMLMRAICMRLCIREGHGTRVFPLDPYFFRGCAVWLPFEENILNSQENSS